MNTLQTVFDITNSTGLFLSGHEVHNLASYNMIQLCPTSGFIGPIVQWCVEVMHMFGLFGLALIVAIENILPFIPSELVVPVAGFAAANGSMEIVAAILTASIASVVGSLILYSISRAVGLRRIRNFFRKVPIVTVDEIDKADAWFGKYSNISVLICRCIPIVRCLISIPAGLNKMNVLVFAVWTFLGSLAWNTFLLLAGFFMGTQWCNVVPILDLFQWVIVALFILLLVWYVWHRVKKARDSKRID